MWKKILVTTGVVVALAAGSTAAVAQTMRPATADEAPVVATQMQAHRQTRMQGHEPGMSDTPGAMAEGRHGNADHAAGNQPGAHLRDSENCPADGRDAGGAGRFGAGPQDGTGPIHQGPADGTGNHFGRHGG